MKTLSGSDTAKKVEKTVSSEAAAQDVKAVEKIDFSKVKIEPLFEEMVDFDTFAKSDYRAVKVKACEAVPKEQEAFEIHTG